MLDKAVVFTMLDNTVVSTILGQHCSVNYFLDNTAVSTMLDRSVVITCS